MSIDDSDTCDLFLAIGQEFGPLHMDLLERVWRDLPDVTRHPEFPLAEAFVATLESRRAEAFWQNRVRAFVRDLASLN